MSNGYMIIGVDPGLMTGLYVYRTYEANHTEVPQGPVQCPAEDVPVLLHGWLNRANAHIGKDDIHIAVERYIITSRTAKLSQQSEALEITGAVKGVAALFSSYGFSGQSVDVRQYAKANLKYASDDMLKIMGWYNIGLRHANDAARQASALLKEVDYPRWCELVKGGTLDTTTNEEMTG
jgi:hypothetical protein